MSDTMLFGVLSMPYEMAMGDELSRRQFYDRVQEAVTRLKAAEAAQSRQPSAQGGGIPPLNSVVGYDDSGVARSLEVLFCDSTPAGLRVAVQLPTPPATSGMKEAPALDKNHLPDLRYIRMFLLGLADEKHRSGDLAAAINGINYIIKRSEGG